jgi:hypothetical protein
MWQSQKDATTRTKDSGAFSGGRRRDCEGSDYKGNPKEARERVGLFCVLIMIVVT